MRSITGWIYRGIIKRILFMFPADVVHSFFLNRGRLLGKSRIARSILRACWRYDNPALEQDVAGLHFKNPIGLSAGFDYNADLVDVLPAVGFGFHTVGTLTAEPYGGNPPPMLGRLPKSRSLLVNKGFKNAGVSEVLAGMSAKNGESMRGVSIGATNRAYGGFSEMIENIAQGFKDAERFGSFDYYELNISCPNLSNIQNLKEQISSPTGLKIALDRISSLSIERPIFIKMPLERSNDDFGKLVAVAVPYPFIKGFIISNLAKDRTNPKFDPKEIACAGKGNFSGKPLEDRSNELLLYSYGLYPGRFVFIGSGGVFTAQDAYKKILCGASLVQLITGMVYMGPQQIGSINKELARLIEKDGYKNVSQAIGKISSGKVSSFAKASNNFDGEGVGILASTI